MPTFNFFSATLLPFIPFRCIGCAGTIYCTFGNINLVRQYKLKLGRCLLCVAAMTKAKFVDLEDELHARAAEMAQYSDFGPPVYRTGLRLLLRAFDQDATFTEVGFNFAYGTVLGTLVARLYAQRGFADSPPAHAPLIRAPLVITGIPRTGTTALHKLLSMDPQFQGLEHWLTNFPIPRPPRDTWDANPLYQSMVAYLEAFYSAAPHFRAIHNMVADE